MFLHRQDITSYRNPPPATGGGFSAYSAHMAIPTEDINNRFKFHPANTPERREAHEQVRTSCRDMAHVLNSILPDSREKALAFTHLEEVMFWGNAGLARQPDSVE